MKITTPLAIASLMSISYQGYTNEPQQTVLENQQGSTQKSNEVISSDQHQKTTANQTQNNNLLMQQVSRASKIIGSVVKNPTGDKLGDIVDLVLNPDNGQVVYAVVSFGGIIGRGDKLFAIPLQALRWTADKNYYLLNMDKITLSNAPGFNKKHWPDSSDSWDLQREGLNQFYGLAP